MSCRILTEARTEQEAIRRETILVAWAALALALVALAYCVRHGTLLLYGDAVAHLHIARRVFDSITPGYRQLGSVWLPLPHILLIPFVANMAWWRNGLAGACLSIPSYVLGCAGIYRLARMWLNMPAAVVVVAFYGLNPGLLYMATTAMNEPLFLAEMIWAVLLIVQFQRVLEPKLLVWAGLVLVCAIFTRYDGWVYAAVAWLFATWPMLRHRPPWRGPVAGAWVLFTALLIAAPSLWLAYNAKQFGDPLDFIRGPYSARAIEARTTPPNSSPRPGIHNLHDSALYFLKAAELGAAPVPLGKLLCWLTAARHAGCTVGLPQAADLAHAAAVAAPALLRVLRGLRIRAHLHSCLAAFLLVQHALWHGAAPRLRAVAGLPVSGAGSARAQSAPLRGAGEFIVGGSQQPGAVASRPLVFQEAVVNARTRVAFETALAKALSNLPAQGLILMRVSSDVGALQQAGIPLRRTVNEGDYLTWQRALEDPARDASTVVALDGDAVAQADTAASARPAADQRSLFYRPTLRAHLSLPACDSLTY